MHTFKKFSAALREAKFFYIFSAALRAVQHDLYTSNLLPTPMMIVKKLPPFSNLASFLFAFSVIAGDTQLNTQAQSHIFKTLHSTAVVLTVKNLFISQDIIAHTHVHLHIAGHGGMLSILTCFQLMFGCTSSQLNPGFGRQTIVNQSSIGVSITIA